MTERRGERAEVRVAVAVLGEDGRIRARDTIVVGKDTVVGAVAFARGVVDQVNHHKGWEAHDISPPGVVVFGTIASASGGREVFAVRASDGMDIDLVPEANQGEAGELFFGFIYHTVTEPGTQGETDYSFYEAFDTRQVHGLVDLVVTDATGKGEHQFVVGHGRHKVTGRRKGFVLATGAKGFVTPAVEVFPPSSDEIPAGVAHGFDFMDFYPQAITAADDGDRLVVTGHAWGASTFGFVTFLEVTGSEMRFEPTVEFPVVPSWLPNQYSDEFHPVLKKTTQFQVMTKGAVVYAGTTLLGPSEPLGKAATGQASPKPKLESIAPNPSFWTTPSGCPFSDIWVNPFSARESDGPTEAWMVAVGRNRAGPSAAAAVIPSEVTGGAFFRRADGQYRYVASLNAVPFPGDHHRYVTVGGWRPSLPAPSFGGDPGTLASYGPLPPEWFAFLGGMVGGVGPDDAEVPFVIPLFLGVAGESDSLPSNVHPPYAPWASQAGTDLGPEVAWWQPVLLSSAEATEESLVRLHVGETWPDELSPIPAICTAGSATVAGRRHFALHSVLAEAGALNLAFPTKNGQPTDATLGSASLYFRFPGFEHAEATGMAVHTAPGQGDAVDGLIVVGRKMGTIFVAGAAYN